MDRALGVLVADVDFRQQFIALDGQTYVNLNAANDAGASVMTYGLFINALINFLIVAFAVFMLVKAINTIKATAEKEASETASNELPADIVLLTEIRDLLKK